MKATKPRLAMLLDVDEPSSGKDARIVIRCFLPGVRGMLAKGGYISATPKCGL
jgi:hypothetical protein